MTLEFLAGFYFYMWQLQQKQNLSRCKENFMEAFLDLKNGNQENLQKVIKIT